MASDVNALDTPSTAAAAGIRNANDTAVAADVDRFTSTTMVDVSAIESEDDSGAAFVVGVRRHATVAASKSAASIIFSHQQRLVSQW